jgi:hypothetical protein
MNTLGKRSFSAAFPSDMTFTHLYTETLEASQSIKTKLILGDSNLTIRTPNDGTGGVIIEGQDGTGNSLVMDANLFCPQVNTDLVKSTVSDLTLQSNLGGTIIFQDQPGYGVVAVNQMQAPLLITDQLNAGQVTTNKIMGNPNLTIITPDDGSGTGGVTIQGQDANAYGLKVDYYVKATAVDTSQIFNSNPDPAGDLIINPPNGRLILGPRDDVYIPGGLTCNGVVAAVEINCSTGGDLVYNGGGWQMNIHSGRRLTYNQDQVQRTKYCANSVLSTAPFTTAPVVALPPGAYSLPLLIGGNEFQGRSGFSMKYSGSFTPNAISGSALACRLLFGPTGTEVCLDLITQSILGLDHRYTCEFEGNLAADLTTFLVSGRLSVTRGANVYMVQDSAQILFAAGIANYLSSDYRSSNTAVGIDTTWARVDFV